MYSRLLLTAALAAAPYFANAAAGDENWTPDRKVAQAQKALVHLQLKSGAKGIKGTVELEQTKEGVRILTSLGGLKPGATHGYHIHEKGDCSAADASSAGGHFNPEGKPHGTPGEQHHVGDLGNVTADKDGKVRIENTYPHMSMHSQAKNSILNKAIVLHAKPDDLKTQPTGDSGDRIACGVISASTN